MPSIDRPSRQSDFNRFSSSTPIVIDNGAGTFRIGWAGESDPRVTFRNVVQRPRHKATGETVTIVGDHDPTLMKYFDCTRSSSRSAFDSDVVYQFDLMEHVLDYGFERLGAQEQVNHPILMTECACNPVSSRSKMAELLFETYGVSSLAFGVDTAFSYKFNQQLGVCTDNGLAICSGLSTSRVMPFVNGEPVIDACCRTNVGGYHVTDYLKQLLSLKYPHHVNSITWEKAEDIKIEHCYLATDYDSELKLFQTGKEGAEEKTRYWQLPWVPPPQEEPPTEEEIARRKAKKMEQGQRLREFAAAKRSAKILELENKLRGLTDILQQLEDLEDEEIPSFLSNKGYMSRQEVESASLKVAQSLRKAKGEPNEIDERNDVSLTEKYPLTDIPDNMLTPEQLQEKKRQAFLRTTTEGKLRAKQKRAEEELQRERQNHQEEEKRLENPELYLGELRAKYKDLCDKAEQRKRLKTNGSWTNGNGLSGSGGRGERLNAAQKERMRLLTTAAFDRGKGEDTFGARDEDWLLYKKMSKDNDDDDEAEDDAELARLTSRLQDIDPTFVPKSEGTSEIARVRPLTTGDFQIVLAVERFRCPEILLQPSMVGVDQAGLDEMAGISFRRLSSVDDVVKERMSTSILLTGGSTLFPGMLERIEAGIRKIRPYLSPLKVVRASDPIMDAWRGAAAYAAGKHFHAQTFSKQDYYEKGENWLRRHHIKYSL